MIKPDGVQRGIVGEILKRFEQRGFKLVAAKFILPTEQLMEQHYEQLSARHFYPILCKYMSSGPIVPTVWEGFDVVNIIRTMLRDADPTNSQSGTIRGDFSIQGSRKNLFCHCL